MSDKFNSNVDALFKGLDSFVTSKTVVGDPIRVEDVTIIPLVDVSCGMAAGTFSNDESGAGGMGVRISPAAVLVVQNGATKVINIKNQDIGTKLVDMIPDILNKAKHSDKKITPKAEAFAEKIAESQSKQYE